MRRFLGGAAALAVLAAMLLTVGVAPASAQTTLVDYTCDVPSGATGLFAGSVPDTVPSNDLALVTTDTPDPVAPGGSVHYDIEVPFSDVSSSLPDIGFDLGFIYLKQIDYTFAIPAGLNVASVTPTVVSPTSWSSVSRQGSNVVYHIQSAFPIGGAAENGRIRINGNVTPTTVEIQQANGTWVPLTLPHIAIDATVSGAAGSSIQWLAPSILPKVKYDLSIPVFIGIHWNDADNPCTANAPVPVIASTLVGSPGLSVTTTADETSVVAGAPIHLHVTATNTGNMGLTGVVIGDANAPGCAASPGTLAVGAHVTIDCTVTTSGANVPTFSNTATADSNETALVTSSPVNVTVTAPTPSGVSGTVTDGSGHPVAGAWIALLRTSDFSIAGGAVADGGGNYSTTVAPGTYFEYLIDPATAHTAGFSPGFPQVTVTTGSTTDADPVMVPSRGAVSSTVTETGTGTPIAGAFALALTSGGRPEIGAVANASGQATLPGLATGNHYIGWLDPAGGHVTQFSPHSPNVPDATPVPVTAGATTTADGSLPTQSVTPGGATLSGTVTEAGTATPLPGVMVMAMHAADYHLARATSTDASGHYSLDVAGGDYKLVFLDSTGTHEMEWHDNQPYFGIASAASVTAPATTNAALDPSTGSMSGTVTDDPSGTPVAGAWVIAIGPSGIAGGATTAANGTYSITGLAPGTYRATLVDPAGGRLQEYWDNASTYEGATTFSVAAGATTANINAALHLP